MPVDVMPYAVQIVSEVVRFVLKEHDRNRIIDSPSYRIIQSTPPIANGGCPYCSAARSLSSASLYVQRAIVRPAFLEVYRELARGQLDDALTTIENQPESITAAELMAMIRKYQTTLADGEGAPPPDLSARMLQAAHIALGMAEKRQDTITPGVSADGQ